MSKTMTEEDGPRPSEFAFRSAASNEQSSGTVEFDADAKVSVGDDGAWVQAWVFVSEDDAKRHECRQHKDTGRGVCCYCGVAL